MKNRLTTNGLIGTRLIADRGWDAEGTEVTFPTIREAGIALLCHKSPDGTLTVTVAGLYGQQFTFKIECPDVQEQEGEHGVHVAVAWVDRKVRLYVDGKVVDSADA